MKDKNSAENPQLSPFENPPNVKGYIPPLPYLLRMSRRARGRITEQNYLQHRQNVIDKADKARIGFAGHFSSFLGANALFFCLNFFVSHTVYPWFLYPLFSWGIGLLPHFLNMRAQRKEKKELETQPELSLGQYLELRQYQNSRRHFSSHLGAILGISALLMTSFLLHPIAFAWPLIPIGALGVGLMAHYTSFKLKREIFKKKFKALADKVGGALPRSSAPSRQPSGRVGTGIMERALQLKGQILTQLKGIKRGENPFGEDIQPVLENYLGQIGQLESKQSELAAFLSNLEHQDLDGERIRLQQKLEQTSSTLLKGEYKKSITELERQKHSLQALHEQQEILELRLKSSLTALNQLHLDLARMKNLPETGEKPSISMLKAKSLELSDYLEDLHSGYNELE